MVVSQRRPLHVGSGQEELVFPPKYNDNAGKNLLLGADLL